MPCKLSFVKKVCSLYLVPVGGWLQHWVALYSKTEVTICFLESKLVEHSRAEANPIRMALREPRALPRPNSPLRFNQAAPISTLIEICSLDMPDSLNQDLWIIPWERKVKVMIYQTMLDPPLDTDLHQNCMSSSLTHNSSSLHVWAAACLTCSSCCSSPPWCRPRLRPKRPRLRRSRPPARRSSRPRQRSRCTSAETARKRGEARLSSTVYFLLFNTKLSKHCPSAPALAPVSLLHALWLSSDLMHSSAGHNMIQVGIQRKHMEGPRVTLQVHDFILRTHKEWEEEKRR